MLQSFLQNLGCVKLHILDEQYKKTALRVSYINKELTLKNSALNERSNTLIWYSDVFGDDVDENSSGFKDAHKAATPEYNKKGKQTNKEYEPEFAKIYNGFKDNPNIVVSFNKEAKNEGTITFDGQNDKGQKKYGVHWDPSLDEHEGAAGFFEESYHLQDAIKGVEMNFMPSGNMNNLDIHDEVRAKMWVANNIKNFRLEYSKQTPYKADNGAPININVPTNLGHIKSLSGEDAVIDFLQKGTIIPIKTDIYGIVPPTMKIGYERYKTFSNENKRATDN